MKHRSTDRPRLTLMEYLFLLPGILALSPLLVAQRRLRGVIDQATAVYGFRLLVLAHLLMFCALILYFWRPSIRLRHSFINNIVRVTCLGFLAVAPISISSLLLAHSSSAEIELFSSLELTLGWGALGLCALANVYSLFVKFRTGNLREDIGRWDILSAAVLLVFLMFLIQWA